ncbi:MAG TPA: c-type cytochrome [Verrucomicrobia bacterium]|nr:c-type cytochrome [Verrucomicrobiota bacterium]HOB33982.1 cbb3-type cytochrome c oxidase N-terminal domain-containing protein [Verrucomicrobiota bacterium]HOP96993.1 cbb3-type cytochrome c oxidase N-terminal domain-containing protein [Verrucomicrobiota bacterium]HPU56657.1 cbb3-type cytochrome c oxidase N-terminal domain-containing protein [Verrucomicrobiota bacterium]
MMNESDPLLLDHEVDGIRELDNKLPRWWVWLFYGTIAFSIGYLVYYHVLGAGPLMAEEYEREMKAGAAAKAAAMSRFEANIASLEPSQDAAVLESGRQLFTTLCAPCHRMDGGGLVGPNLTDDYWIHGSTFADNVRVIWDGVPAKGMITWKNNLRPDQILAVASYIYTLRGAKLETPGKPPENQAPVDTGPSIYE